jgi:hypothetical protein
MPLACLKNNFIHYDLHGGNVLLYKTPPGEYIQYNYYTKHGNISFKSTYIVKIIDYGRCYFKYNSNDKSAPELNSSRKVYDAVCKVKDCDPNCGKNFGYQWLNPKGTKRDNYFIDSTENNISHDLRLLNVIKSLNYVKGVINEKIFEKIKYDYKYGTPQKKNSGLPKAIHNVEDAYIALFQLLQEPLIAENNEIIYETMHKLGEFDIYDDGRPMKYI